MNDSQSSFLAEILQAPEDDGPRMIYADWLEEQGDPRGRFIRIQCELARTNRLEARYYDLHDQNTQLLAEYSSTWAKEVKQDIRKAEFHRGFIDTITIRAREFAEHGETLVRSVPIHWLRFNYVKGAGERLAATAALDRVRSLDLSGIKIPVDDLVALLSSPHLTRLRDLRLSTYDPVTWEPEVGEALRTSKRCEALRRLEILGCDCQLFFETSTPGGSHFPNLTHLAIGSRFESRGLGSLVDLSVPRLSSLKVRTRLRVADVERICRLPLAQVRQLDLDTTRIPSKGLELLADGGAFEQLEELKLRNCDLRLSAGRALFRDDRLAQCVKIDLSGSMRAMDKMPVFIELLAKHAPLAGLREISLMNLSGSAWESLAESESLASLRLLLVAEGELPKQGARALAESRFSTSLRQLSLPGVRFGLEAARELCRHEFPDVLHLDLSTGWSDRRSSEDAVIHVIESGAFPSLRWLNLDCGGLTAKTLMAIAKTDGLRELRELHFNGNRADNDSVRAVLDAEGLPRLHALSLEDTVGIPRSQLLRDFLGRVYC